MKIVRLLCGFIILSCFACQQTISITQEQDSLISDSDPSDNPPGDDDSQSDNDSQSDSDILASDIYCDGNTFA